ncbi:MAG: translocation/assembly module TamB, partial [Prevotellaceae bacterium]|nr:translocation/assembly module TamB [Prevotellaceae bacterium]
MILGVITLLFGLLNMPFVQESIKSRIVDELKAKLNTEFSIEKLHIQPFNTVELENVYLFDQQNEQLLNAGKLYARISLGALLKKNVVITAIRLNDFELNLSKETADAPLNMQFVIDAFKSQDDNSKPSFDVKINSLNLNNGRFRFDVKDKPADKELFDANHIQLSDIHAHIAMKSLKSDSLNIHLKQLSLNEKNGLVIKNLALRLISQNKKMQVKGFRLETPKSLLQLSKCSIDLSNAGSPSNLGNAHIDCAISSSYITPKDVAVFSDALKNFDDRIYLDCLVSGTINDLNIPKLSLDYGDKMQLIANADIVNLLQKDSLQLSGNIRSFYITNEGINGLANNFFAERKKLPKEVGNLGTVSFKGNISGHLKKLKAHGVLHANPGSVIADLDFGFAPQPGFESFFKGTISSEQFKLGQMLENETFNELSFNLNIDLKKYKHTTLGGKVKGTVGHFDYNGYPYRNIELNGQYDGLKMEGKLSLDDENVFLAMNGMFDFSQKQPALNFVARLRNLRPDKLNLSDKYANSY